MTSIYRNDTPTPNTSPQAPLGLGIDYADGRVLLNWDPATDAETANPGLTYNLRIGSTSGADDIMAPHSQDNGWRQIQEPGPATSSCVWQLALDFVETPDVFWSVQAVDQSMVGSPFSTEGHIFAYAPIVSIEDIPHDDGGSIRLTWQGFHGVVQCVR